MLFERRGSLDRPEFAEVSRVQDVRRAIERRSTMADAVLVAVAAVVLAVVVLMAPTSAPAQAVTAVPGDTIASQMAAGRIVSISPDGQEREIASGLASPRGVAVLVDGSILVAETGANRIVGIGGRYGSGAPTEIVSVPYPEALSVGSDGLVYVTLLERGEMGRIDLDRGTYTAIATGLAGPGDVAVRGIAMFVTESAPAGRVVTQIGGDGRKAEFADGFVQPIGLAFGPGATLFVADFGANRIVRIDGAGETSVFAEIDGPSHLAVEPRVPSDGDPYTVVVTAAEGVVRFDFAGTRVGDTQLAGTAGIATVPGTGPGGTPGPTVATTAVVPTTVVPSTVEVTPTAPATTRPPRTTTTISEDAGAPSSTSGGILVASLAIIALIVVGAVVFAVMQRPKRGNKSGFEERSLDTNTVALAFGACAAEEVELAEAEGGVASLETQGEAAEKRLTAAIARLDDARDQLDTVRREAPARAAEDSGSDSADDADDADRSGSSRSSVGEAPAPVPAPTPAPAPLSIDDLGLTTAAGRAALDAFLRREIEADELEEMWQALGEDHAIAAVRAARPVTGPGSEAQEAQEAQVGEDEETGSGVEPAELETDDRAAVDDPVERAEAEVSEAEADLDHARTEIARLQEREVAARRRITAARAALDACQTAHEAEIRAASAAAADEAAAIAARPAPPATPPAPATPTPPTDPDPSDPSVAAAVAGETTTTPATDDPDDDTAAADDGPVPPARTPAPTPTRPSASGRARPVVPERPPLVPDAATVAALRRPRPPLDQPLAGEAPADPIDGPAADPTGEPADGATAVGSAEPASEAPSEASAANEGGGLSDLLARPPVAEDPANGEGSAARIDSIQLAWGERGLTAFAPDPEHERPDDADAPDANDGHPPAGRRGDGRDGLGFL